MRKLPIKLAGFCCVLGCCIGGYIVIGRLLQGLVGVTKYDHLSTYLEIAQREHLLRKQFGGTQIDLAPDFFYPITTLGWLAHLGLGLLIFAVFLVLALKMRRLLRNSGREVE